jgi:DNA-directed RNA polymerase II subunit RPB1
MSNKILANSALGKNTGGIITPDLYDSRLGTIDNHIDCVICSSNSRYCVGHYNHGKLEKLVFNTGYLHLVKKILRCICLKCSRLLLPKNGEEMADMLKNKSEKTGIYKIINLVKNVTSCCGAPVSKIKLINNKANGVINIVSETKEEYANSDKKTNIQTLTPEIVYYILKNISDIDCQLMGFNTPYFRPEMMIQKVLLIE